MLTTPADQELYLSYYALSLRYLLKKGNFLYHVLSRFSKLAPLLNYGRNEIGLAEKSPKFGQKKQLFVPCFVKNNLRICDLGPEIPIFEIWGRNSCEKNNLWARGRQNEVSSWIFENIRRFCSSIGAISWNSRRFYFQNIAAREIWRRQISGRE